MPALIAALMPVTIHWTAHLVASASVSAINSRCREVAHSQRLRHFGQMQVHRRDIAAGQDKAGAFAQPGADRPEDVGGGGTLVLWRRRPRAAARPAAGDLVLLANPRFVSEPDLYRSWLDAFVTCERVQERKRQLMSRG